ncbi:MAG: flagellar basal body L-ring protein FlgH [Deltaproteobacteria bacterium]|nr:MAG: flagellar basal body L-ring protein FlgH [Deltaproteobacteria bacterium]
MRVRWLLAVLAAAGCAGPVTTYKFPKRTYEPGRYDVDQADASGLLWGATTPNIIEDQRSRRLGDLVIVRIDESADASDSASTKASSESDVEAGISNFFGAVEAFAARHPKVDKDALIKALYKSSFKGNGSTTRKGTLRATIACQVKQVLPNGDLFIEGTKTIQINAEEMHLYLSGVVRPYDIDMSNTVPSSRILDPRIDFSGRGVVSDKQRPGFLHRGIDAAWPL